MSISLDLLPYVNTYSSPHQILQHALFVIDNLNADSSGTTKCKAIGKVEGPPLRTMERSQPIINWQSRMWLYFFQRMQIHQFGSQTGWSSCRSPSGTWFLHCFTTKNKNGTPLPSRPHETATHRKPQAGQASLMGPSVPRQPAGEAR